MSKPVKVFLYSTQAHRFQTQIQDNYFVEHLSVGVFIKGLLLCVHINFKCKFQESRQRNKKRYQKKKNALKKAKRSGTGSAIVEKAQKDFEPYNAFSCIDKYTR